MSDHERIAQVAHQKWVHEQIARFLANCSFAHFWSKNERFAQKTDEWIPSPEIGKCNGEFEISTPELLSRSRRGLITPQNNSGSTGTSSTTLFYYEILVEKLWNWILTENKSCNWIRIKWIRNETLLFFVWFFNDIFFQCGHVCKFRQWRGVPDGVNDEAEDSHGHVSGAVLGRGRGRGQAHGAPRGLARDA